MRQQHALIKMNAIFKFACHKDVAKPKSLYISCPVSVFEYFCPKLSKCVQCEGQPMPRDNFCGTHSVVQICSCPLMAALESMKTPIFPFSLLPTSQNLRYFSQKSPTTQLLYNDFALQTYQYNEEPCERSQNSEFQSHFSASKISRIFSKKSAKNI